MRRAAAAPQPPPPPPPPRTKWTRRVPHPVLIGHDRAGACAQAIENEAQSAAYVALRKLLYPGKCGYAAETGGLMADIRTLTVEKIRACGPECRAPPRRRGVPACAQPGARRGQGRKGGGVCRCSPRVPCLQKPSP